MAVGVPESDSEMEKVEIKPSKSSSAENAVVENGVEEEPTFSDPEDYVDDISEDGRYPAQQKNRRSHPFCGAGRRGPTVTTLSIHVLQIVS